MVPLVGRVCWFFVHIKKLPLYFLKYIYILCLINKGHQLNRKLFNPAESPCLLLKIGLQQRRRINQLIIPFTVCMFIFFFFHAWCATFPMTTATLKWVKNIFAFKRGNNFNLFHSVCICITPHDKHLHLKWFKSAAFMFLCGPSIIQTCRAPASLPPSLPPSLSVFQCPELCVIYLKP